MFIDYSVANIFTQIEEVYNGNHQLKYAADAISPPINSLYASQLEKKKKSIFRYIQMKIKLLP